MSKENSDELEMKGAHELEMKEIQDQIAALEARRNKVWPAFQRELAARRDARRKEREADGFPSVWVRDDYAVFTAGPFWAYYGYERSACDEHPLNKIGDDECEACEWCFVLEHNGKEVVRLRRSELNILSGDTCELLAAGLATCMGKGLLGLTGESRGEA